MKLGKLFYIAFASVPFLAGCQGNNAPEYIIHEVNISVENKITHTYKIIDGQRMPKPANPNLDDTKYFIGWNYNGEKFDFKSPITCDMTLFADIGVRPYSYPLWGKITDENNQIIDGVKITCNDQIAFTDINGEYGINVPTDDWYQLKVEKEGFSSRMIYREGKKHDVLDLVLSPVDGKINRGNLKTDFVVSMSSTSNFILRREADGYKAIYEIKDNEFTVISQSDQDIRITESDRVEFYFDTENDGGFNPQLKDYGFILDISGHWLYSEGNGAGWTNINNDAISYDIELIHTKEGLAKGYRVILDIPYKKFGVSGQDNISFSIGCSGDGDNDPGTTWTGLTYSGELKDPQIPLKYLELNNKNVPVSYVSKPFSIDSKYTDNLATITANNTKLFRAGSQMFADNDRYIFLLDLPKNLANKSCYTYNNTTANTFYATSDGYVLLMTPSCKIKKLHDLLIRDGWEHIVEFGNSMGCDPVTNATKFGMNDFFVKYCRSGEHYTYPTWNIAFGKNTGSYEKTIFEDASRIKVYKEGVYYESKRHFMGVPSSYAIDENRSVVAYMTGGEFEPSGANYISVLLTNDKGNTHQNAFIIKTSDTRTRLCDPNFHLTSDNKLIIGFNQENSYFTGINNHFQVVVQNPFDSVENWIVSNPYWVFEGVCINKPTQLSDGSWLTAAHSYQDMQHSLIYRSTDDCLTWSKYSEAYVGTNSNFAHESNLVELSNGKIWLFLRGSSGPFYELYSSDKGLTWSSPVKSSIPGAYSRGNLCKIPGTDYIVIFANAVSNTRGKMTAYLATNKGSGPVVKGELLLDPRSGSGAAGVSYPDATFVNGEVFVTWDYNRNVDGEILGTYLTVNDILTGGQMESSKIKVLTSIHIWNSEHSK